MSVERLKMINTGPIAPRFQMKLSSYTIDYPSKNTDAPLQITYDHTNKRFTEFECNLARISLEDLDDIIAKLIQIRNEIEPMKPFLPPPKPLTLFEKFRLRFGK